MEGGEDECILHSVKERYLKGLESDLWAGV